MKRSKKLIGLIAILAVLVAGYFVVIALVPKEKTEAGTDESADQANVEVISLKAEDVDQITWTYDGATFNIEKGKTGWIFPADMDFPLDPACVSDMMSVLKDLKATRSFEGQDMAEYGLDAPQCVITANSSDGTQTVIKIGDSNAVTSEYYLSLGDSATVYSVPAQTHDAFAKGFYDIVECERMPEFESPDTITVKSGGKSYVIWQRENAGLTYSDQYTWYMDTDQGPLPLGTEKTGALLAAISGITIDKCVDFKPSDLSQYGLDDPVSVDVVETVEYDTPTGKKDASGTDIYETKSYVNSINFLIGSFTDNGCYVMFKDSNRVYLVPKDNPQAIANTNYETLAPDEVCLMDYDTVISMDISASGVAHTVTPTYDDENGKWIFTEGNNILSTDQCLAFLGDITELTIAGDAADAAPADNPLLSITFHRNVAAYAEMTLNFYSYDSEYCLAKFNGRNMLVDRKAVEKLIQAYEDMA